MDGALYRPIATAACGTATAADDSLGDKVIKLVKGEVFQREMFIHRLDRFFLSNLCKSVDRKRRVQGGLLVFPYAADCMPADCFRFINRIRAVLDV